jgi:tripartite-type tricarboxylate transporter receptor subunit TctC
MKRREFLAMAGATAVTGFSIPRASAQVANWPERPVKLIIPYAPGGGSDLIGRPWAEALSQAFGQQFVVENRGGAGGMIGTEAVAKATPDGYTLLATPGATLTVLPHLRKAPYDASKFVPCGRTGDFVTGFAINAQVGPKTFKEMVDYAKKNPGKLSYGSAGLATATHLRLEMLKYRAGIDILHVPYRGSADALNDLLPNNVQMMNEINNIPHVKAGKLHLLNINNTTRHWDFPDIPTLTELGHPDSDVPIWYSIQGPPGLPQEIAEKLNAKMLELSKTESIQKSLRAVSAALQPMSTKEMAAFFAADSQNNAAVIKAANIKLE